MIPESDEVRSDQPTDPIASLEQVATASGHMRRSDQPTPSVDPDDPTLYDDMEGMTTQCSYIVHWYSCRLDAGHEGLHSPGRLPQPPATPSLREAWDAVEPFIEVPTHTVEAALAWDRWVAALASSDPGSPSDGGLDSQTRDLLEACHERNIHSRGDMGYWLNLDSGGDPPPLGSTAAHGERP